MSKKLFVGVVLSVLLATILGVTACSSQDKSMEKQLMEQEMMKKDKMMKKDDMMKKDSMMKGDKMMK